MLSKLEALDGIGSGRLLGVASEGEWAFHTAIENDNKLGALRRYYRCQGESCAVEEQSGHAL